MTCPHCGSTNTEEEGTGTTGVMFFECLDCGEQFDETEAE